jgi:uncharacterized membrane protein
MSTSSTPLASSNGSHRLLPERTVEIDPGERLVSLALGGLLALKGLRVRGLTGLVLAGAGGRLLWRGYSGRSRSLAALGIRTVPAENSSIPLQRDFLVDESITIRKPAKDLYDFWRDPTNAPLFMEDVREVEPIDERHSRWTVAGPGGKTIVGISEIVEERPGELIRWQTEPDANPRQEGTVTFQELGHGRGTVVRHVIRYHLRGGTLAALAAKFTGHGIDAVARENLRRLKQWIEAGELATARRQPAGERSKYSLVAAMEDQP